MHLSVCGFQDKKLDDVRDIYKSLEDDPLLDHAWHSWPHHAHLCAHHEGASAAVADFVLACRGYPEEDDEYGELDVLGPLQVAAFYGLDQLIHSAAQVQHPNAQTPRHGISALIFACMKGNHACAAKLLSLPGTNINLHDSWGDTALLRATWNGEIETVKLLLAVSDIDVNIADNGRRTAPNEACEEGHIDIAKLLLNVSDIDVNIADNYGQTALHGACEGGHIDIVKQLLNLSDVDVNIADNDGRTALHKACRGGHIDVVKLLLNVSDIDVDAQGCEESSEPLTGAVNPSLGRDMVSAPGILVNSVDDYGDTALMDTSSKGHLEVVKLLLSVPGIDIVHANEYGKTALTLAFKDGHQEVANLILDHWIQRCTSEGS
jgi:ankyrin repeat domain-containing protein 50